MIDVGIDDGDRVIIRPCPIVDDGVIALVAIENGSTIKRFYKSPDGGQLVPANDNYKIQEYDQYDQVCVLGRFIKVIPSE